MLKSDYGKHAGQYHPCRGGVRQGRPSGPPFCFLIRERGPFGMPGREKPCVHAGELWRWRRDQEKRQERATAPQAEAGGGTRWICAG